MHLWRIVTLDKMNFVTVTFQDVAQVFVIVAPEYGGPGNFIAVEMEDRQDRSVTRRVEKLNALPSAFERPGFRLAVADHAGDDQFGIVKRGAETRAPASSRARRLH